MTFAKTQPATDSAMAPQAPEPGIDCYTRVGIYLLYGGIVVSTAMMFSLAWTLCLTDPLLAFLHVAAPTLPPETFKLCGGLGLTITSLNSAARVAQAFWLMGAIFLCVQPIRSKSWPFLVFEVSMVLAALLPFIETSFAGTVVLRVAYTVMVMLWLGSLKDMSICRVVLPWYWARAWRGELDGPALAILGSEVLCWGYSLFGINAALGWVGLILGSAIMTKFSWAEYQKGTKFAIGFVRMNTVFIVSGLLQLAWLLLK
jgi:hypothetical protein